MNLVQKTISIIENYLITFLLAFSLIILFITVVMRYVFGNPPTWPEEVSRYTMIWITYLGASQTIERNSEIKIDLLGILLKDNIRAIAITDLMTSVVSFIIAAIIVFLGGQFWWVLMETGMVAASFEYPGMAFIYAIIPISAALMCVKYLNRIMTLGSYYKSLKYSMVNKGRTA